MTLIKYLDLKKNTCYYSPEYVVFYKTSNNKLHLIYSLGVDANNPDLPFYGLVSEEVYDYEKSSIQDPSEFVLNDLLDILPIVQATKLIDESNSKTLGEVLGLK